MLGDRRKFKLRDYFFAYPLKTRQKVQTVTMDMYMPYMEVVREVFPNAKIIIDRFHLVQALNRELNKLRIEVMNAFRIPDHRLYNKCLWQYKSTEDCNEKVHSLAIKKGLVSLPIIL
ncbi:transposase [Aerococcus urinaeequi]|uniref:transposase n=1 Tax=Aerococcus urinaeequi TaxID=51665 RepID=UPI003D6C4EB6